MKTIMAILVLAVTAAGCAKKEAAAGRDREISLQTAEVERQVGAGRIEIDGTVVGRLEAVLSSRLAAPVAEVRAVPGKPVRRGAVLVLLESRDTESALESARAAFAAARGSLDVTQEEPGALREARGPRCSRRDRDRSDPAGRGGREPRPWPAPRLACVAQRPIGRRPC